MKALLQQFFCLRKKRDYGSGGGFFRKSVEKHRNPVISEYGCDSLKVFLDSLQLSIYDKLSYIVSVIYNKHINIYYLNNSYLLLKSSSSVNKQSKLVILSKRKVSIELNNYWASE